MNLLDLSVNKLLEDIRREYPHLVIEMSGPWYHKQEPVCWIVNFKDSSYLLSQVHPGSRGETLEQALFAGLIYLRTEYRG